MSTETGRIGIPNEYFLKMAKHDYEDYKTALPREFYQNSIDADAKTVSVTRRLTDDKYVIVVTDDGCGMDRDVLVNKLLVLGGSHKASDKAVGAFGKAKEVLFFSWVRYTIRTSNYLIEGTGAEYSISELDESIKGTVCEIEIAKEAASIWDQFRHVASLMQTKCKISVEGELIKPVRLKGAPVKEVAEIGMIHQVKKRDSPYMHVRINGVWMFSQYIGSGHGEVVLELSRNSVDILTSNRDGFKWDSRQKVSVLLEDMNSNKGSALRKKPDMIRTTIKGTGKITVGEEQKALAKSKIDSGFNLAGVVDDIFKSEEDLSAIASFRIRSIATRTDIDWKDVEDEIEFIGYEPDFVTLREGNRDITKFMASKKARLLATMWTEILKQVLMDNKRYLRFNAGFTFDKEVEASLSQDSSGNVFYLNPYLIKTTEHRRIIMERLKDLAVHEIAHLSHSNHNEMFVNEMAEVRTKTYYEPKAYYEIQRTRV